MRWLEYRELGWMFLGTLTVAWIVRILWMYHVVVEFLYSVAGLISIIAVIWILANSNPAPVIIWDQSAGILALLRKWSIEISSARLMKSVPIGIDLSHSAKKVLQSVYARYSRGSEIEVVFFVARPLGNSLTKVGFLVRRSGLRFWKGTRGLNSLRKQVIMDAALLESAMRAAYPHLSVTRAGLDDMMVAVTGGIEPRVGAG